MKGMNRRKFIQLSGQIATTLPILALVACESKPATTGSTEPTSQEPSSGAAEPEAGAVCDVSKLPDADKAPRTALGYVEKTSDAAKTCEGCSLYIADIGGCPGCKLFKGPVAPEGYCNSWAPKA